MQLRLSRVYRHGFDKRPVRPAAKAIMSKKTVQHRIYIFSWCAGGAAAYLMKVESAAGLDGLGEELAVEAVFVSSTSIIVHYDSDFLILFAKLFRLVGLTVDRRIVEARQDSRQSSSRASAVSTSPNETRRGTLTRKKKKLIRGGEDGESDESRRARFRLASERQRQQQQQQQ